MTRRLRGCAGMAAPAVMVWLTAVPVAAQAPVAADGATGWTAARTPWGDPDLQGTFTNNNENGIPLERPDDFEARRLEDVTPAPWTFAMHLTRGGPEVQPFEYACHEGNYGLENMLRAARAGEQGP